MRNLDLGALRSLVTVSDTGGVTRAAGLLNLTQSAVSMQLKRLEENLGVALLDRAGRGVVLTGPGEALVREARAMLDINDGIVSRMSSRAAEGEIVLGVPADIVNPAIPPVLRAFAAEFPRVRVSLVSSFTLALREQFARGAADVILTTEDAPAKGAEVLLEREIRWVGAIGGQAWRQRPVRLGFGRRCIFRGKALEALDAAGLPWEIRVESEDSRTIEASAAADLIVHLTLDGMEPPGTEPVRPATALPRVGTTRIGLYVAPPRRSAPVDRLAEMLRKGFGAL